MTRALTLAYKISHHYRERIFAVLVSAIILTACTYVFLLQKAIINVVQRERVVVQMKSLSVDVSDLETEYFAARNKITLNLAHAKGLRNAETVSYISKKSLTALAPRNEL